MRYFLIVIILCFSFPVILLAQKTKIIIKNSDIFRGEEIDGRTKNILVGNVQLLQDSTIFYCDSANLDKELNTFDAFGNIYMISNDSLELFGDRLYYKGDTKIAHVYDNVKLIDNKATLYTDYLVFNRNTKVGRYTTGGRIIDGENILTSIKGTYYSKTNDFHFTDSVVVTTPDNIMKGDTLNYNTETEFIEFFGPTSISGDDEFMFAYKGWFDTKNNISSLKKNALVKQKTNILWGDSIYYDKTKGYGLAFGNAKMYDTDKKILIIGDFIEYQKTLKYAYATDSAVAIIIDGNDSLFLHSDTLRLKFDTADKAEILIGYHKTKFFRTDMQGACDSLAYHFSDSIISMFYNPILWSDENQLTADSIKIFITNQQPDSLVLYNSAFVVSQDDSISFNQVKGRNLIGYFKDKELVRIFVNGNSESLYFVRNETNDLIGINVAVCSNLEMLLRDKEMYSILFLDQPKCTMYPDYDLPADERKLKGFQWLENRRPKKKEDIFIWE